jgi:hypothetical protein
VGGLLQLARQVRAERLYATVVHHVLAQLDELQQHVEWDGIDESIEQVGPCTVVRARVSVEAHARAGLDLVSHVGH